MSLQVGDVIDNKYKLLKELGRGSMGVVFLAIHQNLRSHFAIKFINPELVNNNEARRRFMREARVGANVKHPGIISVTDINANGHVYIVMEYLEGEDLEDILNREERLKIGRALNIATQILYALQEVHKHGFVHRDLKPENIFLTKDDKVKIMDFGIAKARKAALSATQEDLTKAGIAIGTPNYMSPEQACGSKRLNHQTDIWSLGIILYEMLTGHIPFVGDSPTDVLNRILDSKKTPPVRPSELNPEIPRHLERVIMKAIRPEMKARYQDTDEFLADLKKVAAKHNAATTQKQAVGETKLSVSEFTPSRKRKAGITALLLLLLIGIIGFGWHMLSSNHSEISQSSTNAPINNRSLISSDATTEPDADIANEPEPAAAPPPTIETEQPPEPPTKRPTKRGKRPNRQKPPPPPPEKRPSQKRLRPILGGEKGPSKRLRPIL